MSTRERQIPKKFLYGGDTMKPVKEIHFVITKELFHAGEKNPETERAFIKAIDRFKAGDWGELCTEDKDANDADLKARDGHVLGKYHTPDGDIYINLEFYDDEPQDVACLMFCNEY